MKKTRFFSPFFIVLLLFVAALAVFTIGAIDYAPLKQEEQDVLADGNWEKLKAKVHVESDVKMCSALIDDTHRSYKTLLIPYVDFQTPKNNKDITQYILVTVPAVDNSIINTIIEQTNKWNSERVNPDYTTNRFGNPKAANNNEQYFPTDPAKYVMSTIHLSGVTREITEEEKNELYNKLVGRNFSETQLNTMVNGIMIEYRDDSKYSFCNMISIFLAIATVYSFYLAKEYAKNEETADPFAPKKKKGGKQSSYVSSSETSFAKKAAKQEAKKAVKREAANARAEEEAKRRAAREELEAEKEKFVVKQINRDKNQNVTITTSETSSITKKEQSIKSVEVISADKKDDVNKENNGDITKDESPNRIEKKNRLGIEQTKKTDKPVSPDKLVDGGKNKESNMTKDVTAKEKTNDGEKVISTMENRKNIAAEKVNTASKGKNVIEKEVVKEVTKEVTKEDNNPLKPMSEKTSGTNADKKQKGGIIIGNVTNNEGKQTTEHKVGISLGPISSYGETKKDSSSGIPSLPGYGDDDKKKNK